MDHLNASIKENTALHQSPALPVEIYSIILTHPVLVSGCRKAYQRCSLVSKLFRDILQSSFSQIQWSLSYYQGNVRDAIRLTILRKWTNAMKILIEGSWLTKQLEREIQLEFSSSPQKSIYSMKNNLLNDSLVFAMCHLCTSAKSNSLVKRQNAGDTCGKIDQDCALNKILSYYLDSEFYFSDSELEGISQSRHTRRTFQTQETTMDSYNLYEETNHLDVTALETIKILLQLGANPKSMDNFSVRRAARNGNIDLVQLLIGYGADIRSRGNEAIALAASHGHTEIVRLLCEANYGADPLVALRKACLKSQFNVVDYLMIAEPKEQWRLDLIHWLAKGWEREISTQQNTTMNIMHHPLIIAARYNQILIFKKIYNSISETTSTNCQSNPNCVHLALKVAAKYGNLEIIQAINFSYRDLEEICLPVASKNNQIGIITYIFDQPCGYRSKEVIIRSLRCATETDTISYLMDKSGVGWREMVDLFVSKPSLLIVRRSITSTMIGIEQENIEARIDRYIRKQEDLEEEVPIHLLLNDQVADRFSRRRLNYLRNQWIRRFGNDNI